MKMKCFSPLITIFIVLFLVISLKAQEKSESGQLESIDDPRLWSYALEFMKAAMKGDIEKAGSLLDDNPLIVNAKDKRKFTLLHYMVREGRNEAVVMLLERHAAVDARNADGRTPLDLAAETGNMELAMLLISKGGKINNCLKGGSYPMAAAVMNGHKALVEYLIGKGASVSRPINPDARWAPIHWAADRGQLEIMQILVSKGADINDRNCDGMTPLRIASHRGDRAMMDYLIKLGGHE